MADGERPGILEEGVHDRLYQESAQLAYKARIPQELIWTPLEKKFDAAWVREFSLHTQEEHTGLAYVGKFVGDKKDSPLYRMQAIAGALIRNFIDARVLSLAELLPR